MDWVLNDFFRDYIPKYGADHNVTVDFTNVNAHAVTKRAFKIVV
jgi:hypothetical protein